MIKHKNKHSNASNKKIEYDITDGTQLRILMMTYPDDDEYG